ncbi:MAG: sulfurtransferase, partial [Rhodospirillaceae bacterium]|nr:sulfurtransferase [Rhodospirillaceae bacterium]
MQTGLLDPQALRDRVSAGGAVALVDVRRKRPFGQGHILLAVNAPLHCLEYELPRLVLGRDVDLILCDDGSGMAETAATTAGDLGYASAAILDGGIKAWSASGGVLFEGENVLGTILAECVDETYAIPKVTPDELLTWRSSGRTPVVLDSRPRESYQRAHIPGAISCPGGDLVYRIDTLVPDPVTPIVINCAGRSRSI